MAVEPRVRERLFQESREFEKGRQSRPAPWSRLAERRHQGGAAREGAGRWGARGAEKWGVGLPDLANKNTGHQLIVISGRQQIIFSIHRSHAVFGTHLH